MEPTSVQKSDVYQLFKTHVAVSNAHRFGKCKQTSIPQDSVRSLNLSSLLQHGVFSANYRGACKLVAAPSRGGAVLSEGVSASGAKRRRRTDNKRQFVPSPGAQRLIDTLQLERVTPRVLRSESRRGSRNVGYGISDEHNPAINTASPTFRLSVRYVPLNVAALLLTNALTPSQKSLVTAQATRASRSASSWSFRERLKDCRIRLFM